MPPKQKKGETITIDTADAKRRKGVLEYFRIYPAPQDKAALIINVKNWMGKQPEYGSISEQQLLAILADLTTEEEATRKIATEKLGRQQYFYAFSNNEAIHLIAALNESYNNLQVMKAGVQKEKAQLAEAIRGKEDTPRRAELLEKKAELQQRLAKIEDEEYQYRDNDPELIQELENRVVKATRAANDWTDNIDLLLKFYANRVEQFDGSSCKARAYFKIKEYDLLPKFTPKSASLKQPIKSGGAVQHGGPVRRVTTGLNVAAHQQQPLYHKPNGAQQQQQQQQPRQ